MARNRYILGLIILLFSVEGQAPAYATIGGYDICTSADGQYSIDFAFGSGELVEKGTGTTLHFRQISKTLLERKKSICRSISDPAKTFDIIDERYILHISIEGKENTEPYLYCEYFWDSSPATGCGDVNSDLVKEHRVLVPTYKELGATQEVEPPMTLWDHNGSVMYLRVDGTHREFIYHQPKPGMIEQGALPDSLLFDGDAIGDRYAGQARIFNRRCGQFAYRVEGPILEGGRKVVLYGQAPRIDPRCRIIGTLPDRLVFDLVPWH